VDRWGIVAINGVAMSLDSTAFQDTPVLAGGMPTEETTSWGVAVEPIAAGAIGRVAVSGVVQCRFENRSEFHSYVKCKASNTELMSAYSGEGFPLIKSGSWAIVRIGHSFERTTVLATFVAPWPKGSYKIVSSGDKTFNVNNPFTEIKGTGTKKCAISYLNYYESSYEWILTAAETEAIVEQEVITGVTLGSSGLVFTKETLTVFNKKTPPPTDVTISTTTCP